MIPFARENRYLVLKRKDIFAYLNEEERKTLSNLVSLIYNGRDDDMHHVLECVVVEKDWPEYQPTWKLIEERMSNGPSPT